MDNKLKTIHPNNFSNHFRVPIIYLLWAELT